MRVRIPNPTPDCGARPGAPRNVRITNLGNRTRWRVTWDAPSDNGGWEITKYHYGDTGPALHAGAPGKSCGDSKWPWRPYHVPENNNGSFSMDLAVHLPEGWWISVSAVTARGESACTQAQ